MNELNDFEEKTLRAFAELMMDVFDGSLGIVTSLNLDLATDELELLSQVEAIVDSWEDDGSLEDN